MAELLTHVLAAYVLATLLSFRYTWLTPQYVTIAMIGAMIPDVNRIGLVIPSDLITATVGVPWSWSAIHTVGGSAIGVAIGGLLVPPRYRRRVAALLALGAASHLLLDAFLINLSGHSGPMLFPLTAYHPPTPSLYLSSDRWPAIVAALTAAGAWYLRRRFGHTSTTHSQPSDR